VITLLFEIAVTAKLRQTAKNVHSTRPWVADSTIRSPRKSRLKGGHWYTSMKKTQAFTRMTAILCSLLLFVPGNVTLWAQPAPQAPPPGQSLAPDQLDGLVAPIALYPDPLLSQILVASTYPLELVQAWQWLQRNPGLTGANLTQGAQQQNWDPSVQALVVFPDLVKRLNQDITWTTDLGNAFLAQQPDVMDAVQRMRLKAQQAGKLSSTSQQRVSTMNDSGQPVIDIEPADPQTLYLPYYDPVSIWGPPLYYPYANWYYPPFIGGAYFGFGLGIPMGLYFGGGWGGWGGWGWRPGWGNHSVIVNNNFIHRNNFNAGNSRSLSGRTAWSHDSSHRGGVPYSNAAVSNHYGGAVRQNLQSRATAGQAQSRGAGSSSGAERMGNRQIAPSASRANGSAFGGVRDGGAARAHSDHGYSSLGAARSGGSSRGAGFGGGGGGRAGGGGGHAGGGGHGGGGHR
jgi:Protein of unknown function (DUF3300)